MSNASTLIVWILAFVLFVLYVYGGALATWYLRRSQFFTRSQKLAQFAIVWCLPVIGVAVVLHMLGPEVRKRRPGWIPLLEPLLLGMFFLSVTESIDSALEDSAAADAPENGSGDGTGD